MNVSLVLFLPKIVALDVIFALSTFFTNFRSRFSPSNLRGLKVRLFMFATLQDDDIMMKCLSKSNRSRHDQYNMQLRSLLNRLLK
jgi:hypothetical protein